VLRSGVNRWEKRTSRTKSSTSHLAWAEDIYNHALYCRRVVPHVFLNTHTRSKMGLNFHCTFCIFNVRVDFSIPWCSQNIIWGSVSVSRPYETIAVPVRIILYNGTVNHCSFFDVSITVVIWSSSSSSIILRTRTPACGFFVVPVIRLNIIILL